MYTPHSNSPDQDPKNQTTNEQRAIMQLDISNWPGSYNNNKMKAIKLVNGPNGKSVKKILVNRSRSGHHLGLQGTQITPRGHISPYRNSIGLKNMQEGPVTYKEGAVVDKPNEDYFHVKNNPELQRNGQKKSGNLLDRNFMLFQKQITGRREQSIKNKEKYGWESEQNTTENSKFTGSSQTKLGLAQSQYFPSGYQSPSFKIKKLEKEKGWEKKKAYENYEKVLKTEEEIQQNRNQHKIQKQLYEQIIQNLKRKTSTLISSNQKLKNSGSIQTQEGESFNQL